VFPVVDAYLIQWVVHSSQGSGGPASRTRARAAAVRRTGTATAAADDDGDDDDAAADRRPSSSDHSTAVRGGRCNFRPARGSLPSGSSTR